MQQQFWVCGMGFWKSISSLAVDKRRGMDCNTCKDIFEKRITKDFENIYEQMQQFVNIFKS